MLSSRERNLMRILVSKVPNGGMYSPNLFLSSDLFDVTMFLQKMFWDEKRYPGIFARIRRARDLHQDYSSSDLTIQSVENEFRTHFGIFEAGLRMASEAYSATGIGAVAGGFHTADVTIFVVDNEMGEVIGFKSIYAVNDVFLRKSLAYALNGDPKNYTIMLTGSWEAKGGTPHVVYAKLGNEDGALQAFDPSVIHPVRRSNIPPDPSVITIGLGRNYTDQGPGSAMDYAWSQPVQNNPKGMVPFVGSARFDRPIQPLRPKQNFVVNMAVMNTVGGGGYIEILPDNMDAVFAGFSIDPEDPTLLTWNFRPGQTPIDPGNPVVFENVKWPPDMKAIFFFKALVFLQGNIPAIVTVRSNDGQPENPPDGHLPILPISFIWHCLGVGSQVLMADGTQKAIEEIVAGDLVASGPNFEKVEVAWTNRGFYNGKVLQITVADGRSVLATENHVFVTEEGSCLASDLSRGSSLICAPNREGDDLEILKIICIAEIDGHQDVMCNIATRTDVDAKGQMGSFFANGFLVGDEVATAVVTEMNRRNIEYVKSKVPLIYHTDVNSYFSDFFVG
ncbi:hypothetical protein Q1W73_17210 [Asticcacaulis sp. ZE23SCel15]|uniref:Hint domain-containing protein n=1 Tax=Asticcacaulis sp. ZE23SCel15 TaxID=3059027 RepID=UPI00265F3D9A|nr:Hint domain-containing protein [Asticcacaulis sp. ZE23SCel15]WKL57381.1 hypothetical protein Q1W73_17210 [Asticcacaulis sp. ZE23SCel15]